MKITSLFILATVFSFSHAKRPMIDWNNILISDTLDILIDDKPTGSLMSSYLFDESEIIGTTHITVENLGKPLMELLERRSYFVDGNLKSAFQEMKSQSGTSEWELTIENGEWNCTVVTAGVRTTRNVTPVNEHLRNFYSLYSKIKSKTLRRGDAWIDTAIELTSGESIVNTTKCIEIPSKENAYKWVLLSENSLQGKDERWELDTNGFTTYHEVTPFVAVKRGSTPVNKTSTTMESNDLFETFSVRVDRAPTPNDQIVLQLNQSVTLDSSILSMYKKENGKYMLRQSTCVCTDGIGTLADSLKAYLQATSTLQKDHPDIVELAKKLSKDTVGICQRITAYNNYVYDNLIKQNTATFSSAVETLHAGFGDCGEHSVLLAALLRASGIPARVVLGLVYIGAKKKYFGHAWVMAFTGEEWIFADPSHKVFPACYERIPLIIDDNGQKMIRLIGMIGKISIEFEPKR